MFLIISKVKKHEIKKEQYFFINKNKTKINERRICKKKYIQKYIHISS